MPPALELEWPLVTALILGLAALGFALYRRGHYEGWSAGSRRGFALGREYQRLGPHPDDAPDGD